MVGFQKLLVFSLVPVALFTALSLISVILTAHYWILTDYFVGRWVLRMSKFPQKDKFPLDSVIVDYTESSTNAIITSGCLCLAAGVNCMIAFFKLRPSIMDQDYHSPLRRFWTGSAIGMTVVGICSALTALIYSFTDKGDDEFGCTTTTGKTKDTGEPFTNMMCPRERAMCTFLGPLYKKAGKIPNIKPWAVTLSCNEAVAVKWLQLVLIFMGLAIIAMFSLQAGVRRKNRTHELKGL